MRTCADERELARPPTPLMSRTDRQPRFGKDAAQLRLDPTRLAAVQRTLATLKARGGGPRGQCLASLCVQSYRIGEPPRGATMYRVFNSTCSTIPSGI